MSDQGTSPSQQPQQYAQQQYGPPGTYAQPVYVQKRPTSATSVWSLVLSLLWFFGAASVIAVILGTVGLKETSGPEGKGGQGMAVAGLVIGILGTVSAFFLIWLPFLGLGGLAGIGMMSGS